MRSRFGFGRALVLHVLGIAGVCAWAAPPAEASLARSLNQPISAYSASLFGKTSLTVTQKQTLTADPDEPLGGSTTATFDPSVVRFLGAGYGVGYLQGNDSPFDSGFGIEVTNALSPSGAADLDIFDDLETPNAFTPTGFLRVWYKLSGEGVGPTGKLTDSFDWQGSHQDFVHIGTDGPFGVDTHFFDFEYKEMDNDVIAEYSVFADPSTERHAFHPFGDPQFIQLPIDYVIAQNPNNPNGDRLEPGGDVEFQSADVAGTVPEPTSTALLCVVGVAGLTIRRRRTGLQRPRCA